MGHGPRCGLGIRVRAGRRLRSHRAGGRHAPGGRARGREGRRAGAGRRTAGAPGRPRPRRTRRWTCRHACPPAPPDPDADAAVRSRRRPMPDPDADAAAARRRPRAPAAGAAAARRRPHAADPPPPRRRPRPPDAAVDRPTVAPPVIQPLQGCAPLPAADERIVDFEDGTASSRRWSGSRGGTRWSVIADGDGAVATLAAVPIEARCGSTLALRFAGTATADRSPITRLQLMSGTQFFDASAFRGITFSARASAPMQIRVKVPDRATTTAGKLCVACSDHFAATLDLTTTLPLVVRAVLRAPSDRQRRSPTGAQHHRAVRLRVHLGARARPSRSSSTT